MCSCCSNLLVLTVNNYTDGDANKPANDRLNCVMCVSSKCETCRTDNQRWTELDEAFFILECNLSRDGWREAVDMVEGRLRWRSSPEHEREVPNYLTPAQLRAENWRDREKRLGFVREEGCTCLCRDDASRDLSLACPVHK